MAEDKREAILARLAVIFKTVVDDEKNVFRNRIDIPETNRPAVVILDADETASQSAIPNKRPAVAPVIVGMTPEIYILAGGKPDVSFGKAEESGAVGGRLNALRAKAIKAVLSDATLVGLCHDGDIRYEGFATGLASGRSMEGAAGLSFTFSYALYPTKL